MTSLCVALIAGYGFSILWRGSGWARGLAILLLGGAVFESWPMAQQRTPNIVPTYVAEMRTLSKDYGLFDVDDAFGPSNALYYQTVHEIPMVHGYISRVPTSVAEDDAELDNLAGRGQWQLLCERYGIRYLVFRAEPALGVALASSRIFRGVDGDLHFYDLGQLWSCASSGNGPIPDPVAPVRWEPAGPRTGAEKAAGVCVIDSVNSRDPRKGGHPFRVPRLEALKVIGWAIQREGEQAPESVRLRLERSDSISYEAPARRMRRPDVARHLQDARFEMAGFKLLAGSLGSVPAGVYRLTIVQGDNGSRTFCEPGVELALP